MGEMAHRMESAIEYLGTEFLQSLQLEPLLTLFDAIQANFDQLRALPEQDLSLPEVGPVAAEAVVPESLESDTALALEPVTSAPTATPVPRRSRH